MKTHTLLSLILSTTLLAGCYTPKSAIKQANQGAALVANFEKEIRNFKKAQEQISRQRIHSIQQQDLLISKREADILASMRSYKSAGVTDKVKLYESLRDLADNTSKDNATLDANIKSRGDQLTELVKPLPSTTDKMSAAQKAFSNMGIELTPAERASEINEFYKSIQKTVDENKVRIDQAKTEAEEKIKETAQK